jgi:hypothetical protein
MTVTENQSLERKNKSISLAAKVSFQEHEGFVLRPFVLSLFCFKTPYQFALLHKLCHLNFGLTLFGSLVSIILFFFLMGMSHLLLLCIFCYVYFILLYVHVFLFLCMTCSFYFVSLLFCLLFVCKCVLYSSHSVSIQLQLANKSSYI